MTSDSNGGSGPGSSGSADGETSEAARRHETGAFLRSVRRRLSPEQVNLVPRARRRGDGLSREEVAYLAGISADWYGRLESGADIAPSAGTLQAICRALRMNAAETEYVFGLSRVYAPRYYEPSDPPVPEAVAKLIASTERVGLLFFDAYLTVLAWNAVGDLMFNISPHESLLQRNAVVRMADPYYVDYFRDDYDVVYRGVVGSFRRAFMTEATPLARQVVAIAQEHPKFQRFWEEYAVSDETALGAGPHTRHHPLLGSYSFLATDLHPLRRQDTLRVLSPFDDESAKKFVRLARLGKPSR